MENKTVLEKLDSKISLMIQEFDNLKEENRLLRAKVEASRETEAMLRQEILKLKEEEELKELELEDIALKISKTMGELEEKMAVSA